jgi:hypothetical protein
MAGSTEVITAVIKGDAPNRRSGCAVTSCPASSRTSPDRLKVRGGLLGSLAHIRAALSRERRNDRNLSGGIAASA